MFQHSVDRLAPLFPPERILVVTSAALAAVLRSQAPEIPAENFIIEPVGRDSAPAAGLAALHLLKRDRDAVMVLLTADHYIIDTARFRSALTAARKVADSGTIVTLGIRPTFPSTGFGYIRLSDRLADVADWEVYRSGGFREKPELGEAIRMLDQGSYVWNSGMFTWRADRLLKEFDHQMPECGAALRAIGFALGGSDEAQVLAAQWPQLRRTSVDYGVMEHAEDVAVIPVDIGWSDIGSWGALVDALPQDEDENVLDGPALAIDTRRSYIRSSGRLIAAVGLEDMVIVDTPDVLLVCPRSRAEDIRDIVAQLNDAGKTEYL
jgi:mannose-1-phosphate guanylyltransferase